MPCIFGPNKEEHTQTPQQYIGVGRSHLCLFGGFSGENY